jgi:hypothetical protein
MLLNTPDGGPLLAHWFVGLGQVASLTTGTSSRWADAWRTGAGFRHLFGQMSWEMLRVQTEDNLELHVENVSGRADVRHISVVTPNASSDHPPIVTISRGRREGVRLDVHASAPGVWTAYVALGEGFVVDARMPSSLEPTVASGAEQPYAPELRAFGSDVPMLAAIARAGGGRVIPRIEDAFDNVSSQRVMRDARMTLLLSALVLYLLGILAMRLPLGPDAAARKPQTPRKPADDAAPDVTSDREAA